MAENIHDLVYSDEVLEFVKVAKQFTDFVTQDSIEDRKMFINELLVVLPMIYSRMMNIPENQPVYDDSNEKWVTEENWSDVYQRVYGILGSQNEYLDLPDRTEYDRLEVISRELSEDIADIYQDIRDFLEVFRVSNEEVMNDVLWECRMNFENYWGLKLTRACFNLHISYMRDSEQLEQMDSAYLEKHRGKEFNTSEWFISKRQQDAEE